MSRLVWILPGNAPIPFGEKLMTARLCKFVFNRNATAILLAVGGFSLSSVADAQIQQQIDRCAGKDSASLDTIISACNAVIGSETYSGKDVAFAFNNRGNAHYAQRL